MQSATIRIIGFYYYISQFLGILSFSYDYQTGRARTKPIVTIYCAIITTIMFAMLPLLLRFNINRSSRDVNVPDLHIKINGIIIVMRIFIVLLTIVINWTKRQAFIKTINDYQHFHKNFQQRWPLSARLLLQHDKLIMRKFCTSLFANIAMISSTFDLLRTQFNINNPYILTAVALTSTATSLVVNHFFLCIINNNLLYTAINEEIKSILKISFKLHRRQTSGHIRVAVLRAYCFKLATELDYLATVQYKLRRIGLRLKDMYALQAVSMLLTVYMNEVGIMYMSYMFLRHNYISAQHSKLSWIFLPIALVLYYLDLIILTYNIFKLKDLFVKTSQLLRDGQLCWPTLDVRLDESFKNFSLQLAKFPIEMKLVGLFQFDRPMAFAMFASTISNAIVLMQYDFQHNYN